MEVKFIEKRKRSITFLQWTKAIKFSGLIRDWIGVREKEGGN